MNPEFFRSLSQYFGSIDGQMNKVEISRLSHLSHMRIQ